MGGRLVGTERLMAPVDDAQIPKAAELRFERGKGLSGGYTRRFAQNRERAKVSIQPRRAALMRWSCWRVGCAYERVELERIEAFTCACYLGS